MCVWVYQFVISYQSGLAGSYMSLSNDDYCDPVQISFQDEWALDDGGYWSSNPRWGFAASMASGESCEKVAAECLPTANSSR